MGSSMQPYRAGRSSDSGGYCETRSKGDRRLNGFARNNWLGFAVLGREGCKKYWMCDKDFSWFLRDVGGAED